MSGQQKFYITTAISYPNGEPHIGHAYEAIATDAIARFERLDGKDAFFLTGTDEHGLKMKQTAQKEGLTPRALADRNSKRFREMAAALNLSNDDFIRTTEQRHYRSSEEIWRRMEARTTATSSARSTPAGTPCATRRSTTRRRPRSGADGMRRGPQGTPVEWTEEETYFFRLSAYQDKLLAHYEANPDFILPPERRNEVMSFVRGGLDDLSISRTTLDWGIPVPGAPEHVMYVWVDALTNYITGAGFPDETSPRWRYWPADVHVIGKDILRFHAVYWPAFLMSAGIELPKRVFSHGFVLNRGEKMSKSVGNVVDPFDLVNAYGVDQVRYFFLREVVFGQDGNYSPEAIANRINADLANDLGNLAQRSLSMIAKNCGGGCRSPATFTDADKAILAAADALYAKAREAMDRQAIKQYLDAVWAVVADANRYFAGEEPWAKGKTDPARMGTILYVTAEVVRQVAILAPPVTPAGGEKLLDAPGAGRRRRAASRRWARGGCEPGTACRRRPACSRATSSPRPRRAGRSRRRKEAKEEMDRRDPDCSLTPSPSPRKGREWAARETQSAMMLVDHHCHLDFPRLRRRSRRHPRARQGGGRRRAGDDLDPHPPLRPAARRSPRRTTTSSARSARIRTTRTRSWTSPSTRSCGSRAHPKVVAIGEAGLDYFYDNSPREAQAQGFRNHIAAARETQLPLVIHARDADDDVAAILEEETAKGAFPAVLHCYTGGAELARRGLALGLYVSFSGIVTFKKSDALRDIAALGAARPAAGRDGRALPGARQVSRQAQRAGLRGGDRGHPRQREGRLPRGAGQGDDRQLLPPLQQGAARGRGAHEHALHAPRLPARPAACRASAPSGAPAIRPTPRTGAGAAACWSSASARAAARRC